MAYVRLPNRRMRFDTEVILYSVKQGMNYISFFLAKSEDVVQKIRVY